MIVPRLEIQRRQYSVSAEEMHKLLADAGDKGIEPRISVDELSDLLNRRGEISDVIKLQGKNAQITALLETLAKDVYYYKIPWQVEQCEDFGIGDAKFHQYIRQCTELKPVTPCRQDEGVAWSGQAREGRIVPG